MTDPSQCVYTYGVSIWITYPEKELVVDVLHIASGSLCVAALESLNLESGFKVFLKLSYVEKETQFPSIDGLLGSSINPHLETNRTLSRRSLI